MTCKNIKCIKSVHYFIVTTYCMYLIFKFLGSNICIILQTVQALSLRLFLPSFFLPPTLLFFCILFSFLELFKKLLFEWVQIRNARVLLQTCLQYAIQKYHNSKPEKITTEYLNQMIMRYSSTSTCHSRVMYYHTMELKYSNLAQ